MITEVFHKHYPHVWHFSGGVPHSMHVFMHQAAQIVFQDLSPHIEDLKDVCNTAKVGVKVGVKALA